MTMNNLTSKQLVTGQKGEINKKLVKRQSMSKLPSRFGCINEVNYINQFCRFNQLSVNYSTTAVAKIMVDGYQMAST